MDINTPITRRAIKELGYNSAYLNFTVDLKYDGPTHLKKDII